MWLPVCPYLQDTLWSVSRRYRYVGTCAATYKLNITLGGSGIVNSDIPAGKDKVKITCWVYVIKGKVDFAYGPTGVGIVRTYSTTRCKWEKLEMIKSGSEACNQVTLYSKDGDAEFYVDAVSVVKL